MESSSSTTKPLLATSRQKYAIVRIGVCFCSICRWKKREDICLVGRGIKSTPKADHIVSESRTSCSKTKSQSACIPLESQCLCGKCQVPWHVTQLSQLNYLILHMEQPKDYMYKDILSIIPPQVFETTKHLVIVYPGYSYWVLSNYKQQVNLLRAFEGLLELTVIFKVEPSPPKTVPEVRFHYMRRKRDAERQKLASILAGCQIDGQQGENTRSMPILRVGPMRHDESAEEALRRIILAKTAEQEESIITSFLPKSEQREISDAEGPLIPVEGQESKGKRGEWAPPTVSPEPEEPQHESTVVEPPKGKSRQRDTKGRFLKKRD